MKKVLWLCNNPTPKASKAFGWNSIALGGWLIWLSETLSREREVKLYFAFLSKEVKTITKEVAGNVLYYAVPNISKCAWEYCSKFEENFSKLLVEIEPDIIHIWGTEYQHSLAMIKACETSGYLDKCVVSIQGLVGIYAKYYFGSLSDDEKRVITLRDIVKKDTLHIQQKHFAMRGVFEIEALRKVKHVIGRTDWDFALVRQVNPNATYHVNNENLRDVFYSAQWSYDDCQKHSIFISQAQYPIKGLDVVLKALPEVLKYYPNTKVYVSGAQVIYGSKFKKTSYEKILVRLIEKYELQDTVCFVGMKNEEQMVEEYLKANIFVCPSAIENSPNSVGEAMMIGTPVIASYVGGTNCLLTHNAEGFLYQADADYMLAHYILKVFSDSKRTIEFSQEARKHAQQTHDRTKNYQELLKIYALISEEN